VRELAKQLRATLPADAGDDAIAAVCSDWLQANRRYQLPGGPGFARSLGEFLIGSGAGHCEYFATALALLLRVQEVPCRLVGGFLAHEWQEETRSMLLRGKHAHAWVEVLGADGTWHTVDPTPAADVRANTTADDGWLAATRRRLDAWWSAVTGFDQETRGRWLAALLALPRDRWRELGAGVAIVALVIYLRRRRRQTEPTIVALQRALQAAGLTMQRGETPRELLARAALAELKPTLLSRLRAAALQHEANRYGTSPTPTP
jgi:hypothetical protein